ncbi:hypothetical protein CROQUDRAFT_38448, partial [Cronartium quercuum f. sp. fusiforme G11]
QDIHMLLNVQHNCHKLGCTIKASTYDLVGPQGICKQSQTMFHSVGNEYILNSASLYSAQIHCEVAKISFPKVLAQEWKNCIMMGLARWKSAKHNQHQKANQ